MPKPPTILERILGGSGFNTGVDPRLLTPPGLLLAENCWVTRSGEMRKRPGLTQISNSIYGGSTAGVVYALAGSANALFAQDATNWLSYDSVAAKWNRLSSTDAHANYLLAERGTSPANYSIYEFSYSTFGYVGGYTVGFIRTGGITVVHDATGAPIGMGGGTITGVTGVRFVSTGTRLFALSINGNDLNACEFNTTTLSWGASSTLANDATTAALFDAMYWSTGGGVAIAYKSTGGGTPVKVLLTNAACTAVAQTYTGTDIPTNASLGMVANGSTLFVGCITAAPALRVIELDATLSLLTGPTSVDTTAGIGAPLVGDTLGSTIYWFCRESTSNPDTVRKSTHDLTIGTITSAVFARNARITSCPIATSTELLVPIATPQQGDDAGDDVDPTGYLVDSAGNLRVRYFAGDYSYRNYTWIPPRPVSIGGGEYYFLAERTAAVEVVYGTGLTTGISHILSLKANQPQRIISVRNRLIAPGGCPLLIDPQSAFMQRNTMPLGFTNIPQGLSLTAGTTGALTANGTYRYRVVYYRSDPQEGRWLGAPSYQPATKTSYVEGTLSGANDDFTVTIPTNRIGGSALQIYVYRTTAGGSIFRQVGQVANDNTVATVDFVDTMSDATLLSQEPLYTHGGEVDNYWPGNLYDMDVDAKFAYGVPQDSRGQFWVTKPLSESRGVEFSDSLVYTLVQATNIEAVRSLDGLIVVLAQEGLFYFQGDGKNALGQGGYTDPKRIPSRIGCKTKDSVAVIPPGIVFQGTDGLFYLLGRDLQLLPIGRPAFDYSGQTILFAHPHPTEDVVVFGVSGQTYTLVFDYRNNAWYKWTGYPNQMQAATTYDSQLVMANADGYVYKENASSFKDGATSYNMKIRTDWLKFGSNHLGNFRRLQLLGEYVSPHTLTINVYKDYDTSSAWQTATFTVDSSTIPYQFELLLKEALCTAIMIEIQETPTSGTEESCRWSSLTVECQDQERLSLVPETRRK